MPTRFSPRNVRALLIGACMTVATLAQASDDAFLAARDAFAAGNRQAFERHAAGSRSSTLLA